MDGDALTGDASFDIQYHINRQLDRARGQRGQPDLVSTSTTPHGGIRGSTDILASGGGPLYRPSSIDPYSEPMLADRYMTLSGPGGGGGGVGSLPGLHPPTHRPSESQLLSLKQHHRASSPLGVDLDSESEYSAFRTPQDGTGAAGPNGLPQPYATNSKMDLYNALLGGGGGSGNNPRASTTTNHHVFDDALC